jgi:hypothetical protein
VAIGDFSFWMGDKMSVVDVLLCTGGTPIDNRSSRTSVPAFWTWFVPERCKQKS